MDMRDYIMFLVIGVFSFILGGLINQAVGISGSQNILAQFIAFVIPLTILYYVYFKVRRRA